MAVGEEETESPISEKEDDRHEDKHGQVKELSKEVLGLGDGGVD